MVLAHNPVKIIERGSIPPGTANRKENMTKFSGDGAWIFTVDQFMGNGKWEIRAMFYDLEPAESYRDKLINKSEYLDEVHFRMSSWAYVPPIKMG